MMWMETVAFTLRLLIIVLGITALFGMFVINWPLRHRLSFGEMMRRLGIAGLVVAIIYGTVESHLLAVPPAPRLWVLLVAMVWFNIGLVASIRESNSGGGTPTPPSGP